MRSFLLLLIACMGWCSILGHERDVLAGVKGRGWDGWSLVGVLY